MGKDRKRDRETFKNVKVGTDFHYRSEKEEMTGASGKNTRFLKTRKDRNVGD